MKTIKEFLEETQGPHVRPHILCKDGLKLSVQASDTHYCRPRRNKGPYYEVEIGFPSEKIEELMEYAEDAKNPTGTVYGNVPVDVVDSIIEAHGGIKAQIKIGRK